jgi:hypothetical protein
VDLDLALFRLQHHRSQSNVIPRFPRGGRQRQGAAMGR